MNADVPPMLEVRGLSTDYRSSGAGLRRGVTVPILEELSLEVRHGETLGLVGESGCGKTTLLLSILRLVTPRSGSVLLEGEDFLAAHGQALRRLRRDVQVVFQNPFSSLDPRMKVADLVAEPLRLQGGHSRIERQSEVLELLDAVGVSRELAGARSSQLSGGQAQRVAIARAIALRPKLLLLDEPTSSLDLSVQAQVLNLLVDLQQRYGLTYLFVSHDLRVIQHVSDRIAVMYLGEIIETGPTDEVFANPAHPYTQTLLVAAFADDRPSEQPREGAAVPSFASPPAGCRFHTRCPYVMDICKTASPASRTVAVGHSAACHLTDADNGAKAERVNHPQRAGR
jgi:oligopeptide/dipeptide ABC transporter ATP-binding protein